MQNTLAEMARRIDVARVYSHHVVERQLAGDTDLIAKVCFAKNTAVEAGEWVASQAVQLFGGMGYGMTSTQVVNLIGLHVPPFLLGTVAGIAVALIFFLRMSIEEMAGKAGTTQASVGGFEIEDILYLLPLVTLADGVAPFLVAASIGAPLFAAYVVIDYRRVVRRTRPEQKTTQAWVSR